MSDTSDRGVLMKAVRDGWLHEVGVDGILSNQVDAILAAGFMSPAAVAAKVAEAKAEQRKADAYIAESEALIFKTGHPSDVAYNNAIRDAAAAIRQSGVNQ